MAKNMFCVVIVTSFVETNDRNIYVQSKEINRTKLMNKYQRHENKGNKKVYF